MNNNSPHYGENCSAKYYNNNKNNIFGLKHYLRVYAFLFLFLNFNVTCFAQETFEYINSQQKNVISYDKNFDVSFYKIKLPVQKTINPNFIRIEDCNSVLSKDVIFLIQDQSIDNAFLYKIDENIKDENFVEVIEEPLFNNKDSLIISNESNNIFAINCKLKKISKYDRSSKTITTKNINLLYREKYNHWLFEEDNKLYLIGGYDTKSSFCNIIEVINLKDLSKEKTIELQSNFEGGTLLFHCSKTKCGYYLLGCKSKIDDSNDIIGIYTDKNFSSISALGKLKFNPDEDYIVQSHICSENGLLEDVIFLVNRTSNKIYKIDMNNFSKELIEIPAELENKNLKIFFPYFIFDDKDKFYLTIYKSDKLNVFSEIKKTDKNSECKKLYKERFCLFTPTESEFIIVGPPKEGNIFELIQIKKLLDKKKGNIW